MIKNVMKVSKSTETKDLMFILFIMFLIIFTFNIAGCGLEDTSEPCDCSNESTCNDGNSGNLNGNQAGNSSQTGNSSKPDNQTGTNTQTGNQTGNTNSNGSNPYNSEVAINAFLEGKTLIMTGSNVPSHPLGINEDMNAGQATQCYHRVSMNVSSGIFHVRSEMGTLRNADETGQIGECDHDIVGVDFSFDSQSYIIANVKPDGSCYDFTVSYQGFSQEGRAAITPDGKYLTMELYFEGKAGGHRCADGPVGAQTVRIEDEDFVGDARQVFEISETVN